jgi:hypothetical protein
MFSSLIDLCNVSKERNKARGKPAFIKFTSFLSAVLRGTLHKYNSLLSFIAHGIVPCEMKDYYIYAKCPSTPLMSQNEMHHG